MLAAIARFELRYHLWSPLFWVSAALFFLFAFGSVTSGNIQIGGGGNVRVNSPFALLQTVGVLYVFGMFVVVAFVAGAVVRDEDTGFAPIVYATRVGKVDYLLGRFCGAVAVAFLVMAAVPLGVLVGTWMPWVDAEKLGPFVAWHYAYAMGVFGLPTLLVMATAFFALATVTRSMLWTYVGVMAFLVLYLTSRLLLRDPAYDAISAWSDPFGLSALGLDTRYWTAAERNARVPALTGMLAMNRALWLAISLATLGLTVGVFRFGPRGRASSRRPVAAHAAPPASRPVPHPASAPAVWGPLVALTRFEIGFVLRSPAFAVLVFLGLFNGLGAMTAATSVRGVEYLPVTRAMVDALTGSFTLFPIIVAIFYGGELVWRDKERRMHEIVDASSTPDWTFVVPKVVAITVILAVSFAAAVLGGMAFQLWKGYTVLEPGAYVRWFLLPRLVDALLLGVLAVFVQTLVPAKVLGWAVMLVYVVASVVLGSLGYEHALYNYGASASVPLSDMNGLGHFWIGRAWHHAYWLSCAGVLLVLSHLLWRRGVDVSLRPRLARAPRRLAGGAGLLLALAATAWLAIGAWVFYNTNVRNRYQPAPDREALAAAYEKALLPFESRPQPTITHVTLDVALYPREVRAVTEGAYTLENRTGQALDTLHLQWPPELHITRITLEGATVGQEFPDFGHRVYTLTPPLQPGEQRTLGFATVLEEQGFVNDRPQTSIVGNGSFLNNMAIAPMLGVSRARLLTDRAKRRKHGLPAELRPAPLEDETARAHHYLRRDSDWVTADITLSTDADQVPIAPGYTRSDTTVGGRRTLVTRTEAPIQHFFSLQSARYAVQQETWTPPGGQPVTLAVYYHPPHAANVPRMLAAMTRSLEMFSTRFSPYQFRQARIIEFPAYASFAQSFANTVPYSESIGFVQAFDEAQQDEKIDLVTYVTAHEIAHQWWAHQIIGADRQGMTLLSESFAQYSALLVMEDLYGKAQLRKFLKSELDRYLRARGGEFIEELPLNRVENQAYIHYQKGALVMYALKEQVGESVVNRALQRLLAAFAFQPAPYPSSTDFLRLLREEAGPAHEAFIADQFEKITLFDLKATSPIVTAQPDGRTEVRFTVEARKRYADGTGQETEAPLDEWFDVGAFTVEPGRKGYSPAAVVAVERRRLVSGPQEVRLLLDRMPAFVGVDPFNVRIDRDSNDNVVPVR